MKYFFRKILPAAMACLLVMFCTVKMSGASSLQEQQRAYIFYTAMQSPIQDIFTGRIQEAFRRIGLKADVVYVASSQRGLMQANDIGDGDAGRVPHIKEIAPDITGNLIQIPESVITIDLSVYSKTVDFRVDGWQSLVPFHNGGRIGAKILEKNIPGKRTFLPTTAQLMRMLNTGRLDTVVEWKLIADKAIKDLGLTSIHELSPPIKSQSLYLQIHKKHQGLVAEITRAFTEMKKDGTFDRIEQECLVSSFAKP